MTSDEKIDALTERVDALTQSVELLASMHRDNEARMAKLVDIQESLTQIIVSHEEWLRNHERRLDDLEQ